MRFKITLFSGNMGQDCGATRLIETASFSADSLIFYRSRAYFCQQCGRIWARWDQEDTGDLFGQNFFTSNRSCPDHQTGCWYGDIPGSLLMHLHDILVLPRNLLEYELITLMENMNERTTYARFSS